MTRVPWTGGEKESLVASLDRQRDVVLWKLDGLPDDGAARAVLPSGTSALGLVKHLAAVEYLWFCTTFGAATEPLPFSDDDPDADLRPGPDDDVASVRAFFLRARAAADAVIATHDVDDTGTAHDGPTVTLRWVLIHMIEEEARHAGHLDVVRELLDGATGDFPWR